MILAAVYKLATFLILSLLACIAGCRSNNHVATDFYVWGWENAGHAKLHLDGYKHVLIACVYDGYFEDGSPHRLTSLHLKATVVKSFKGDWKISEKMNLLHYVDYSAPANSTNPFIGKLIFVSQMNTLIPR